MSKYHSKKVELYGRVFDSKKEAERYLILREQEKRGNITNLTLQPKYVLQPAFRKNGKSYREITYIADFTYIDFASNKVVIEDVKGFKTEVYKIKKKLFEFQNPDLTITEI